MQSQVSAINPVLVEITAEVPWDHVEKDLDSTYKRLARTAQVRGFRPGKVPLAVVKKLYKGQVESDVTRSLVEQSLMAAVEEHNIQIVSVAKMPEAPVLVAGEKLTFKAEIEVRPTVDKVDLEGIEVFEDLDAVDDSKIDARIEELRQQNADLAVPDPMRPAKSGDRLLFDYKVVVDGVERADMTATGSRTILGSSGILPDFEAGLTGMSPGESKDIEVTFPEDWQNEELKGKTVTFKVDMSELREQLLPDLDDEFAKDVGDFADLAALRASIKTELEAQAKRSSEDSIKEQIIEAVVAKNEIPLPPSMVSEQQRNMLQELLRIVQMSGQNAGQFGPLLEGMQGRAESRVRAGLLLGAIARLEGIDVSDADVDAKLAELAESSGKHIAKLRAEYQGERRAALESHLLETKLMAMLKGRVTVKPGKKPEAPAADSAADAG